MPSHNHELPHEYADMDSVAQFVLGAVNRFAAAGQAYLDHELSAAGQFTAYTIPEVAYDPEQTTSLEPFDNCVVTCYDSSATSGLPSQVDFEITTVLGKTGQQVLVERGINLLDDGSVTDAIFVVPMEGNILETDEKTDPMEPSSSQDYRANHAVPEQLHSRPQQITYGELSDLGAMLP